MASDALSNNWKVCFFKGYMADCNTFDLLSHESVANALQRSFDHAALQAPEKDQHLVASVREQVTYFSCLQNEEEKARELNKCKEGMELAKCRWAKLAPENLKAHFFVEKFVSEAKKRQQTTDFTKKD